MGNLQQLEVLAQTAASGSRSEVARHIVYIHASNPSHHSSEVYCTLNYVSLELLPCVLSTEERH